MYLNAGPTVPWSGVVRPHAVPGLSSCLEERRLTSDGRSIPVSPVDVDAVRLAEWAVAGRRPLLLCPPDPLSPLSALIAAAVHVADMTDAYRRHGFALRSNRHVAVVSSDYRLRGIYRGLGVRGAGSSTATLRSVVPAATFGRDGAVRVLDSQAGPASWSTIFVRSVHDLRRVGALDLAVIELPIDDPSALLDLDVPVVIVARDPADPIVVKLAERASVFGWDSDDLAALRGVDLPSRVACRAEGATCRVVAVADGAVAENAALFWQDIGPLVRSSRRSAVASELSREAFGLFHDLLGLALPVEAYEQSTLPVRVRLGAVAAAARLADGEARDLYLPMVELELRDLASALGSLPSKYRALRGLAAELLDEHGDVLLIARTAELARLYEAHFANDPLLRRLRVTSIGALADEPTVAAAVLTGMAPTWARWVYRAGVASTLHVLSYAPDAAAVSDGGFSEAATVQSVVSIQTARERWLARPATKARSWAVLSGERILIPDDVEPAMDDPSPTLVFASQPPEVPPGLWDGRDWLTPLESGDAVRAVAGDAAPEGRLDAVVAAVKVTFADGRWAVLDLDGTVTRFRPGSGTADPGYGVRQLRAGDQVLFLDGDSRKDLLGKVLEVAVEVPALAVAAGWVSHWRRVLAASYRSLGTYEKFAARLREFGCAVQTQTIRLWVIGVTIGPEDPEDVLRVGRVAGDEVLLNHRQEVVRAMRSLRGAHAQLGRRLAEIAVHVGAAAAAGHIARDEVIDERSGLTVADFQDSLDLVTVQSVDPAGDVPLVITGRLQGMAEDGDD
jgi:hypothetical protein